MINKLDMMGDIERVLFSEEQLTERIKEVGAQISKDYYGKDPVVVGVLKGVVPFYCAMTNCITVPLQEDFMCVSSYAGMESTGKIILRKDVDVDLRDRHVLILEDILDSGRTLKAIQEMLRCRQPASLKICTLFDKPEARKVPLEVDYVCFHVPNEFVVGFGLDYNEYYRNLPFVGVLKPSVYQDEI